MKHLQLSHWPYPRWLAHRGAGTLAPENTLAAMRLGVGYGYRMFECDVQLSADGLPFLLHDRSLERCTDATTQFGAQASTLAYDHPWSQLAQLDAGSWHSRRFAGEPLATLRAVARFCLANGYALNLEIKPAPGTEHQTGTVVAQHAARLWHGQSVPPLLSSFVPSALQAARDAAPALPRALLLETLPSDWLAQAQALECCAIVCHHPLWNAASLEQAKNAGFRTLAYTVNDPASAQRLLAQGIDGLITDRIDWFAPGAIQGISYYP